MKFDKSFKLAFKDDMFSLQFVDTSFEKLFPNDSTNVQNLDRIQVSRS